MKTEKTRKTTKKKSTETEVAKTENKPLQGKTLLDKKTMENCEISQSSIATLLGLASSNVVSLTNSGALEKNSNGNYDLIEQVRKYVKELRDRKSGVAKGTLETEALKLKNEKQKTYIESWRRKRDKVIAIAIIEALKAAMMQLKQEINNGIKINDAIENVISGLKTVDYDIILEEVENDNDDEDEE